MKTSNIIIAQGKKLEMVSCYRYLGIWLDDFLSFKSQVDTLFKKLRLKFGLYFRNKTCFSFEARKRLVSATFLTLVDYNDLLYINVSVHCLHMILHTIVL